MTALATAGRLVLAAAVGCSAACASPVITKRYDSLALTPPAVAAKPSAPDRN